MKYATTMVTTYSSLLLLSFHRYGRIRAFHRPNPRDVTDFLSLSESTKVSYTRRWSTTNNNNDEVSSLSSSSSSTEQQQQQQQQEDKRSINIDIAKKNILQHQNNDVIKPFFRMYYNDIYEVHLPPKHRFPMKKYRLVRQKIQQWISNLSQVEQNQILFDFVVSPLATTEELATTHSIEYIQRFLNGQLTPQEERNVGFPWSEQHVNRTLSSVGGTVAAACDVCEIWRVMKRRQTEEEDEEEEEEEEQHQQHDTDNAGKNQYDTKTPSTSLTPPWAAHIAGGTHHAFYDYGEGFSVFSDIAVAANVVLQRYPDVIKDILILDTDTHQGNGNSVLFQDRPEVSTVSFHCEGNYFSPKQQSDLDIELPIGCTDATYLATLQHWLRVIEQHKAKKVDLIFFQSGVDILDVDRLGRMDVSSRGVRRRNDLVYEFAQRLNVPLVICMGGGYPKNDDLWEPILDAHANVYFQAHNTRLEAAAQASSLSSSFPP